MIIKYSKNYSIPFNTFLCICFWIFIVSKHFDKETDFGKQKGMEYRLAKVRLLLRNELMRAY